MTRRDAGFTLLEMLVALVVFGLLMAGIAQAMRYGMTAWSAETRQAAAPETMSAVDGALRRLIEHAGRPILHRPAARRERPCRSARRSRDHRLARSPLVLALYAPPCWRAAGPAAGAADGNSA
jgi:prepilin-type N-terminal cleavage/methylation domain-containing protein